MSNVQQFGDIDVKLLPNMLEKLSKGKITPIVATTLGCGTFVNRKLVRKWDKAFIPYQKLN